MLKSSFMQHIDLESEDGKLLERSFKVFASLSEDILGALAQGIPELHRLRTRHEVDQFIEQQTSKLGISRTDAAHTVEHIMLPIVRAFAGRYGEDVREDTPEILGEDIADTLHFVSKEDKGKLVRVLALLKNEIAPVYEQQQRLQKHAAGVLPSWVGIGTTVEMRAILTSDYRIGGDVEQYSPSCVGMVPVASISLRVDQGDPERFYFQLTEEELLDLIDSLQATLKEIQEFKKHLAFSEEPIRMKETTK